jgi:hypothetical protein
VVANAIETIGFAQADPPLALVAGWVADGLSASQAGYAALAEWLDAPLVATDEELLAATPTLPHDA